MIVFGDFDLTNFWDGGDYEKEAYIGKPLGKRMMAKAQRELGCKLPPSYIELLRIQNGGIPNNTCHRTEARTSWAHDHVAISGIYGLDRKVEYSLCGGVGSRFMIEEWGYPPIGVYFANCPSAGHDMLCLDYRAVEAGGEPAVVHVDQEVDYRITLVAPNFESFIRGLVNAETFPLD